MLRYNRKSAARNQGGVASTHFRPTAALTLAPKASSHHRPYVNINLPKDLKVQKRESDTSNVVSSKESVNDGRGQYDSEEKVLKDQQQCHQINCPNDSLKCQQNKTPERQQKRPQKKQQQQQQESQRQHFIDIDTT